MKKPVSILLAIIVLFGALALCGCKKGGKGAVIEIRTPDPGSSVIEPVPTDVPDFTPAPTASAAPADTVAPDVTPTPAPVDPSVEPDQTVFDDAVFIGNSVFEGLYRFGVITHGKFFTKVGLNVNSVMTDHADGSSVPVIDELKNGTYGKVIVLLGTNELGWPSYTTFIQKYSDLIDAIHARQPGAKIYVTALPPVTKKVSETSTTGITNENIVKMNGLLRDLAERKSVYFIDVPAELYDSTSSLPEEASSDGIHLNLKYDRIWADHITRFVMGTV